MRGGVFFVRGSAPRASSSLAKDRDNKRETETIEKGFGQTPNPAPFEIQRKQIA
jgi:hypothetical protein